MNKIWTNQIINIPIFFINSILINSILIINFANFMLSSLKLTTNTILGKEQLKKINLILQSLFDNNDSFEFRQPVDWKTIGLTDYPLIVKTPMDLGTIRKKILNSRYQNTQQVLDDIQLIWDNCKIYNQVGSWIHNIADKLQKSFKKMLRNYFPHINIAASGIGSVIPGRTEPVRNTYGENDIFQQHQQTEQITYQQKLRFSQRIKNLTQQQLGKIVVLIQQLCPDAFKQVEKDRAQIIVDNLDNQSFKKLNEKIDDFSDQQDKVVKKVKI